jgi:hypothetical protein
VEFGVPIQVLEIHQVFDLACGTGHSPEFTIRDISLLSAEIPKTALPLPTKPGTHHRLNISIDSTLSAIDPSCTTIETETRQHDHH